MAESHSTEWNENGLPKSMLGKRSEGEQIANRFSRKVRQQQRTLQTVGGGESTLYSPHFTPRITRLNEVDLASEFSYSLPTCGSLVSSSWF